MTASYQARRFGVHSAMPSVRAKRLCPELIFVPPRFDVYRQVSEQIRSIFLSYTPLVEPLSLDEAYLDVTDRRKGPPSGTLIARAIKQEILETTGLTSSAGVSFNKFLAKTASAMNKPDGLTVIVPDEADAFLMELPVERFHGIGGVTARKLKEMGINVGADLRQRTEEEMVRLFGRLGRHFYRIAWGVDDRRVNPDRERKSFAVELTFSNDLETTEEINERLEAIVARLAARLARAGARCRTVTLKLRTSDFETTTRTRTVSTSISSEPELRVVAHELMSHAESTKTIRLLGLTGSNLITGGEEGQLGLGL